MKINIQISLFFPQEIWLIENIVVKNNTLSRWVVPGKKSNLDMHIGEIKIIPLLGCQGCKIDINDDINVRDPNIKMSKLCVHDVV